MRLLLLSALATLLTAGLVLIGWRAVLEGREERVARIGEATARATEGELRNELQLQENALHDLAHYWARNARRPEGSWGPPRIDLERCASFEVLAWLDATGEVRFFTEGKELDFERRPNPDQQRELAGVAQLALGRGGAALHGPLPRPRGQHAYAVTMPVRDEGYLVAVTDAQLLASELLRDEAPGYALTVRWKGQVIHRRGEAAAGTPGIWRHVTQVELPLGGTWELVHQPTPQLLRATQDAGPALVLGSGLLVALLVGGLVFENGRARERARAAEDAEGELRLLNRDLERRVAARTGELEQVVGDLETLNDSISHELRNPLATIGLRVALLREDAERGAVPAQSVEPHLRVLADAAEELEAITHDLVGFSRAARGPLRCEPVDMESLARRILGRLLRCEPGGEGVEAVVESGLPPAFGDRALLELVWSNLLGNAVKFSRGRALRRVEVAYRKGGAAGGEGAWIVSDRGPGFDPTLAERIFEPFERGGSQVEGTGLGLAIVARVVRRHGGRVWAESRPGEGATFAFTLPGEPARGAARPGPAAPEGPSAGAGPRKVAAAGRAGDAEVA